MLLRSFFFLFCFVWPWNLEELFSLGRRDDALAGANVPSFVKFSFSLACFHLCLCLDLVLVSLCEMEFICQVSPWVAINFDWLAQLNWLILVDLWTSDQTCHFFWMRIELFYLLLPFPSIIIRKAFQKTDEGRKEEVNSEQLLNEQINHESNH